ncbi:MULTISPECIES: hypothetical protein [Burkholderia]|uniref:hypothetical protein n=1 Tax=Burkholderia TaxID=32008 RepID=UPI001FC8396F|nr:hypothetical protein [Burkholderia sp. BCC0097]
MSTVLRRRLTPVKAIQKDEAPPARRKSIQTNEAFADTRPGRLARLDALRIEIRALITDISHAADVELLDLMVDEIGAFARHKAAQDARTWATTAAITLETGLMQLARATRCPMPASCASRAPSNSVMTCVVESILSSFRSRNAVSPPSQWRAT